MKPLLYVNEVHPIKYFLAFAQSPGQEPAFHTFNNENTNVSSARDVRSHAQHKYANQTPNRCPTAFSHTHYVNTSSFLQIPHQDTFRTHPRSGTVPYCQTLSPPNQNRNSKFPPSYFLPANWPPCYLTIRSRRVQAAHPHRRHTGVHWAAVRVVPTFEYTLSPSIGISRLSVSCFAVVVHRPYLYIATHCPTTAGDLPAGFACSRSCSRSCPALLTSVQPYIRRVCCVGYCVHLRGLSFYLSSRVSTRRLPRLFHFSVWVTHTHKLSRTIFHLAGKRKDFS